MDKEEKMNELRVAVVESCGYRGSEDTRARGLRKLRSLFTLNYLRKHLLDVASEQLIADQDVDDYKRLFHVVERLNDPVLSFDVVMFGLGGRCPMVRSYAMRMKRGLYGEPDIEWD